jgi:hypothetical protein
MHQKSPAYILEFIFSFICILCVFFSILRLCRLIVLSIKHIKQNSQKIIKSIKNRIIIKNIYRKKLIKKYGSR